MPSPSNLQRDGHIEPTRLNIEQALLRVLAKPHFEHLRSMSIIDFANELEYELRIERNTRSV